MEKTPTNHVRTPLFRIVVVTMDNNTTYWMSINKYKTARNLWHFPPPKIGPLSSDPVFTYRLSITNNKLCSRECYRPPIMRVDCLHIWDALLEKKLTQHPPNGICVCIVWKATIRFCGCMLNLLAYLSLYNTRLFKLGVINAISENIYWIEGVGAD